MALSYAKKITVDFDYELLFAPSSIFTKLWIKKKINMQKNSTWNRLKYIILRPTIFYRLYSINK